MKPTRKHTHHKTHRPARPPAVPPAPAAHQDHQVHDTNAPEMPVSDSTTAVTAQAHINQHSCTNNGSGNNDTTATGCTALFHATAVATAEAHANDNTSCISGENGQNGDSAASVPPSTRRRPPRARRDTAHADDDSAAPPGRDLPRPRGSGLHGHHADNARSDNSNTKNPNGTRNGSCAALDSEALAVADASRAADAVVADAATFAVTAGTPDAAEPPCKNGEATADLLVLDRAPPRPDAAHKRFLKDLKEHHKQCARHHLPLRAAERQDDRASATPQRDSNAPSPDGNAADNNGRRAESPPLTDLQRRSNELRVIPCSPFDAAAASVPQENAPPRGEAADARDNAPRRDSGVIPDVQEQQAARPRQKGARDDAPRTEGGARDARAALSQPPVSRDLPPTTASVIGHHVLGSVRVLNVHQTTKGAVSLLVAVPNAAAAAVLGAVATMPGGRELRFSLYKQVHPREATLQHHRLYVGLSGPRCWADVAWIHGRTSSFDVALLSGPTSDHTSGSIATAGQTSEVFTAEANSGPLSRALGDDAESASVSPPALRWEVIPVACLVGGRVERPSWRHEPYGNVINPDVDADPVDADAVDLAAIWPRTPFALAPPIKNDENVRQLRVAEAESGCVAKSPTCTSTATVAAASAAEVPQRFVVPRVPEPAARELQQIPGVTCVLDNSFPGEHPPHYTVIFTTSSSVADHRALSSSRSASLLEVRARPSWASPESSSSSAVWSEDSVADALIAAFPTADSASDTPTEQQRPRNHRG